ncbi:Gfo/Idh/MocA family oxidoreductase [bacterium]|nr:Gfo/Idh/MocA family oxidoreductase [bacterium]
MKQISVIGAGQIGSRHLQSIARISSPVTIHVVDPVAQSLGVAAQRVKEIPGNNNIVSIHFHNTIKDLPSKVDFCIIATAADIRFSVMKELIEATAVEGLLLEKVLFQTEMELEQATALSTGHHVKSWVNCNKRLFPIYARLKELIPGNETITFTVKGDNWGLACNAIHFIDLVEWLTGKTITSLDTTKLDRQIHKSKRNGFIELTGTLLGKTERGDKMVLVSTQDEHPAFLLKVESGTVMLEVIEQKGELVVKAKNDEREVESMSFSPVYQSNLTHMVVENYFKTGQCELPTLEESARQHLLLVKSLNGFIHEITGKKVIRCPIT